MEIELWWLLAFPLFFSLGWIAARIDIKQLLSESRALPLSYFKGLNFLLNEQPDKAIEAFIEVVKVDPQTVELHFALGNLFRRRGEVERAIRMHQNLAERADLAQEQKLNAMFELAKDYLKAGLLDRAEEFFGKLQGTTHAEAALKNLLEIYQQEKDWQKAIDAARHLEKITNQSYQKEIANFYCELAANELMHSRLENAGPHLDAALAAHRKCARASILQGDLEVLQNRHEQAITAWKRIETQNPAYLSLVAEKIFNAYRHLDRFDEGARLLSGYLFNYSSLDLLNVVFQATLTRQGAEPAYQLVRDELKRNPTLLGLDKLLEAQMLEAPPERRHDLELMKNLVHSHTRSLALYRCEKCGFRARQFYWRCPACGGWETYPPRRTEEHELAA
ncbi:MAG TPA: lipopolysaccharide assembly protein LapB [Burkholderiales bacterium]|nr:lipopolysaccharide assembly protein LapB [Burkholderiales bacterium]